MRKYLGNRADKLGGRSDDGKQLIVPNWRLKMFFWNKDEVTETAARRKHKINTSSQNQENRSCPQPESQVRRVNQTDDAVELSWQTVLIHLQVQKSSGKLVVMFLI